MEKLTATEKYYVGGTIALTWGWKIGVAKKEGVTLKASTPYTTLYWDNRLSSQGMMKSMPMWWWWWESTKYERMSI